MKSRRFGALRKVAVSVAAIALLAWAATRHAVEGQLVRLGAGWFRKRLERRILALDGVWCDRLSRARIDHSAVPEAMIDRRRARAWIVAAGGGGIVALVLITAAWNSRRGDYSDCLRTAAAIRPGQNRAEAISSLARYALIRNEDRQVTAICHPSVPGVHFPYYPVMALEISVEMDERGRVASVHTNDVLVWRKRDARGSGGW